ncbi:MAG: Ribosomal RNA small subunit methyltransferase E [Parcubacteria group bacterium GW2011_GWD2_38_12]|nr:MAG: Ribosomal RNA small subunit methyltransferase E [Parcubacteria group bacterium GW2011_GWC2_36_17]KKQ52284.1 MAG: Ribosomal RNA small subunit methyltransferase E [Parcubacteria group bacterium GW2011_GWD2_38_12]KKQ58369.1 MAG: Ribosomal RNA small subunit methyltransferase E [Parcubacteria group bacterium GW2011_GWD1_38_16]KKQ58568.1 MAG: Ribosomal RNA small subunit methyltransferase E [Parcubacteria group bacterium GW2011_GWC1_38_17]
MHRRFFIDFSIDDKKRVSLHDEGILHQLSSVFRVKLGENIILLDNSGFEYDATIKDIGKKEIIVQINDRKEGKKLNVEITLFQSLLKKDNVELIFEKCTEIGVSRFMPVLAEHSIKLNLNDERLQKIVKEASEQCGRARLPMIDEAKNFDDAIMAAISEKDSVNFILHEEINQCCDKLSYDFLKHFYSPRRIKKFNLFVGPEGGFSKKEIELAKKNNFYVLSLGDLVLRSETAAIVASYAIATFNN